MADFAGLTGADRDAVVAVTNLFKAYGLETLAPKIVEYVTQGYGSDVVTDLLKETPEYKQRFSANASRVAKGLSPLSPAEYLATERSYRQIMSTAGMPAGFYDQPSDFSSWLENDVSPTEIKSRVDTATELVSNADPATLNYFRQHYSTGDLVAYALDQKRAVPLIEKQAAAARLGAAAAGVGTDLSTAQAEGYAQRGLNANQIGQGYGMVRDTLAETAKLNALYGGGPTQGDLVDEAFNNGSTGSNKTRVLASKERAAFSGSGGQSKNSLGKTGAGQF